MRNVIVFVLVILFSTLDFANAHPGKTNAQACHSVSKNYEYKSGKVLKAGTRHCHRGFGKMKFDGKEILEDRSADKGQEVKPQRTKKQ